jgi:hypothetical protein
VAVSFDRLVTVKGTLIQFVWANPHPRMTLEVQNHEGRTEKWLAGGPAIMRMAANGWAETTVKPDGLAGGTAPLRPIVGPRRGREVNVTRKARGRLSQK